MSYEVNKHSHYNSFIDLSKKHPNANSPITFDKEGKVLSVFKDDIWDMSSIQIGFSNSCILDFTKEGTGLNSATLYHLKLIIYYELFYAKKLKDVNSFRTIRTKYIRYKTIAHYFKGSNSSFLNLKKNNIAQKKYLSELSLNKSGTINSHIGSFLFLNSVGAFFEIEGFGFNDTFLKRIDTLAQQAVKTTKQTILIPSRIYSEFINSSLNIFEKFGKSSEVLKQVFVSGAYTSLNPNTGRVSHLFEKFANEHGIRNFIQDFEVKTSSALLNRISQIQAIGFLLIACFSGMRNSEIKSLSQECLSISKLQDKEIYGLNGHTSKTSNIGIRKATWITSSLIEPVIKSLKDIIFIVKSFNDQKGLYQGVSIEEYPLFPHFCYSNDKEINGKHSLFGHPPTLLNGLDKSINKLLKNIEFCEDDLEELTRFNPLINWREEYKLEIGKNWKFRPHQFRRSLVVYGIRSGMIQLTVLKKQLQHLNLDMTTYYGNSTGSATNLFDESLIEEFREENVRYQFVQYEEKVLDTTDTLYGGEGTRLHLSKRLANTPEYLVDKAKTLQYFNEGRLSYKKTPLGGCARQGSCNKLGFAYITACIDCKDSIFDSSSTVALKKTRKLYEERLKKYDFDSITYKQIKIEIDSINKILNKIKVLEINNVQSN